jgi:zinc/manganese transport system substrate-binding protein
MIHDTALSPSLAATIWKESFMTTKTRAIRHAVSVLGLASIAACAVAVPAVSHAGASGAPAPTTSARIVQAVGAENEYADVIRQIGGGHISVLGVISDPTTDPHTYESSTTDANAVAKAQLIVQNGVGYDDFMSHLAAASPSKSRTVIDVGSMLGYKTGANPHLWYKPTTMTQVAVKIASTLARYDPADKATFNANLTRFVASLTPWKAALNALHRRYAGTPVAVTEPVFDYTLQAAGFTILTPHRFELAIQEGNDPSPQDAQIEANLISQKKVKAFFYNQQAVEAVTTKLLGIARAKRVPIVGVYETMPLGKNYQSWMMAEVTAVAKALGHGVSTERIS